MSKKIKTNQKHMTQDNRVVIEKGLDASKPLSSIAAELGKDPTTISKEIKKHRAFQEHNKFNEQAFRCALSKDCHKKHVCSTELYCKRECKRCNKCHNFCKDFVPFDYSCPKTKKAPYVCNGCSKKSGCRLDKYYYRATRAHKEYKTILVESRAGINASEEEIKALDDIISPLVENGQSVYTMESYSQYPPKITMHSSFLSFPISIISLQTNKSPYFLILPSKLSFLLSFFTSLSFSSSSL